MTAMLKRLFEQPGTFDKDGWLTIGVCGEQKELGDTYLSTPCVYLCSLGFLPLGFRPMLLFGVSLQSLGQV